MVPLKIRTQPGQAIKFKIKTPIYSTVSSGTQKTNFLGISRNQLSRLQPFRATGFMKPMLEWQANKRR